MALAATEAAAMAEEVVMVVVVPRKDTVSKVGQFSFSRFVFMPYLVPSPAGGYGAQGLIILEWTCI